MFGKHAARKRIGPTYEERIAPMEHKRQLEALNVPDDHPVLAAVLSILRGIEELAKQSVTLPHLQPEERAYYAGGMSIMGEAQEIVLQRVDEARDAAQGKGRPTRCARAEK
jgi:hypothetical protein